EEPRLSPRDGRDDHRPSGQNVDVPREAPRLVYRYHTVCVSWVTNLQPAGFDDVEIDVRLAGPKHDVAVCVIARLGQVSDEHELSTCEAWKGSFFCLSHSVIPTGRGRVAEVDYTLHPCARRNLRPRRERLLAAA